MRALLIVAAVCLIGGLAGCGTQSTDRVAVCESGVQEIRVINAGNAEVVPLELVVCKDGQVFRVTG